MDMFLEQDIDITLLLLPDGDDPDSFAKSHTPEEVRSYIDNNTTDVINFKARVLAQDIEGKPEKRVTAVREMVKTLSCISDKIKRDVYIQECSRIMNLSESTIRSSVADAVSINKGKKRLNIEHERLSRDLRNGKIQPSYRDYDQSDKNADISPHHTKITAYPELSGNNGADESTNKQALNKEKNISNSIFDNSLRPHEWNVIKYCIRYGFLNFCEAINSRKDENPETVSEKQYLTVVEYVKEEMDNDNLSFSIPEYYQIFSLLLDLLPSFRQDLSAFNKTLEDRMAQKEKEGFDSIALKQLSIAEIQREEEKLKDEIEKFSNEEIVNFSRVYPSRILASDENDFVRELTNAAVLEPHQLSHIYSRERPVEKEEDKLYQFLPMAVTVWKNGILDIKMKNLVGVLKDISGKGKPDEERKLQAQLSELMKLRSEVAKNIGDRIICPVTGKQT